MKKMLPNAFVLVVLPLTLSGCTSFLPASGASTQEIIRAEASDGTMGIQVVDVTNEITRQLLSKSQHFQFASLPETDFKGTQVIGTGDVIEVYVWETPPAALFATNTLSSAGSTNQTGAGPTRLPPQQVNAAGTISVPFAGVIPVAGLTLQQIEKNIQARLKGKANSPQVMVSLVSNNSCAVTVVGEVNKSGVIPLTPKHERLLDALAKAEGTKEQVNALMVQLTRGGKVYAMPLEDVIRDSLQNIYLQPNDVVTVLYQPLSFTVLGASGRNAEINFEAKGISLAQALARSGGLRDEHADAQGVFIFRYESVDAFQWTTSPTTVSSTNTVPVVYRVSLRNPNTFFAAQSFPIHDKDVIYIATAPATQLKKFLSLVSTIVYPSVNTASDIKSLVPKD